MMTRIAELIAENIKAVWPDAEGLPAAEEKDIFVVLRIQRACRAGCQTD